MLNQEKEEVLLFLGECRVRNKPVIKPQNKVGR